MGFYRDGKNGLWLKYLLDLDLVAGESMHFLCNERGNYAPESGKIRGYMGSAWRLFLRYVSRFPCTSIWQGITADYFTRLMLRRISDSV